MVIYPTCFGWDNLQRVGVGRRGRGIEARRGGGVAAVLFGDRWGPSLFELFDNVERNLEMQWRFSCLACHSPLFGFSQASQAEGQSEGTYIELFSNTSFSRAGSCRISASTSTL